jgi:Ig-like domain CHU_C associated
VTNASACISPASANVVINIQPATPSAPTATVTAQPTCSLASGTITVTAPAGAGVSFTVIGTTPVVAAQNNTTGIFSGLAAGNYDVTATVNGCTSVATALTVNPEPLIPAAPAVSNIAYCQNATATPLTATALSDHTLQWYNMNATGGTASATAPTPSTGTTGTITYFVSQKNNTTGCEGSRAGISVSVKS